MKVLPIIYLYVNTLSGFFLLILFSISYISYIPKLLFVKDFMLLIIIAILTVLIAYAGKIKIFSFNKKNYILLITFLIIVTLYFFITQSSFDSKLIYFRKFLYFILMFILFSLLPITYIEVQKFLNHSVIVFYISFVFGALEYMFPVEEVWGNFFMLPKFWDATGLDPWANIPLDQSGRFYTYDLYFLIGEKIRRVVSIFLDPTLYSAFLYFILPYAIFKPRKKTTDYFLIFCIILMGMLTVSKAFLLSLFINLFFFIVNINPAYLIISLITLILLFVVSNSLWEFDYLIHGSFAHISGLITGLNVILKEGVIFGLGLGNAGNYSNLTNIGGESGFGSLISQLGLFGFLFVFFIYSTLEALHRLYKLTKHWVYKAGFVSLFSWFMVFLFSESSLGITGNSLIFVLIGMLLNQRTYHYFKEGGRL